MGIHLRELGESYLMNTNMTGLRWFSKNCASLCFGPDESSLRIGRVKHIRKDTMHHKKEKESSSIIMNSVIVLNWHGEIALQIL